MMISTRTATTSPSVSSTASEPTSEPPAAQTNVHTQRLYYKTTKIQLTRSSAEGLAVASMARDVVGPILWGHSGPLCHALSLLSLLSWTSMRRRRATVAACDSCNTWWMAMWN